QASVRTRPTPFPRGRRRAAPTVSATGRGTAAEAFGPRIRPMTGRPVEVPQPAENCIGLVVESWTATQGVVHFGVAHNNFSTWVTTNGDHLILTLRSVHFHGVATFGP